MEPRSRTLALEALGERRPERRRRDDETEKYWPVEIVVSKIESGPEDFKGLKLRSSGTNAGLPAVRRCRTAIHSGVRAFNQSLSSGRLLDGAHWGAPWGRNHVLWGSANTNYKPALGPKHHDAFILNMDAVDGLEDDLRNRPARQRGDAFLPSSAEYQHAEAIAIRGRFAEMA